MTELLNQGFQQFGLQLQPEAATRFQQYYEHLTEKNKVMNLTAISGETETAQLHFLDCVKLLQLADLKNKSAIDVGTGAGFPGLPLKIAEPSIKLTLLDSLNKRVDFLAETCGILGFTDVPCLHARAEEAAAGPMRESFDFALSRAVARLNILCELCLPFVKVGGSFLAMKGPDAEQEAKEAEKAIALLGGRVKGIEHYDIPGTDLNHCVVVIEKIAPTPKKYPRAFAKIKKSPL